MDAGVALWWLWPKQHRKSIVVVDGDMVELKRGVLGGYRPREWGGIRTREDSSWIDDVRPEISRRTVGGDCHNLSDSI